MATLTEKEWTVDSDMIEASFYAELRDNIVCDVYVTLHIDGFVVTWNQRHKNNHGLICVYEIGKLTQDWIRLLALIGKDNASIIEQSLKDFLNSNLTYKN